MQNIINVIYTLISEYGHQILVMSVLCGFGLFFVFDLGGTFTRWLSSGDSSSDSSSDKG